MARMQAWRLETSAPLINAVVNKSVPLQLTNQSDSASKHSLPAIFSGRLAPQILKWNVLRSGLSVARNLEVHTGLLHYCTFGLEAANDAQNTG